MKNVIVDQMVEREMVIFEELVSEEEFVDATVNVGLLFGTIGHKVDWILQEISVLVWNNVRDMEQLIGEEDARSEVACRLRQDQEQLLAKWDHLNQLRETNKTNPHLEIEFYMSRGDGGEWEWAIEAGIDRDPYTSIFVTITHLDMETIIRHSMSEFHDIYIKETIEELVGGMN